MRVLLIQPPLLHFARFVKLPNIGLASIAAVLEEAGIEVKIIDANAEDISLDEIITRIKKINPDIVGSGGQTPISHLSLEIFKRTKTEVNKNIVTLAGGPHFSFTAEESLQKCPELDLVVRGEAEYTTLEICNQLDKGRYFSDIRGITYRDPKGNIIKTQDREPIADLDALPFPAWHLFPIEKYNYWGMKALATTTARGCTYKCPQCITWKIHKGLRLRTPKRIVDEMVYVKENFNHDTFFLHDDQSFTNRDQLIGFLNEIERRNVRLYWSIETREELFYKYKDLWDRMKDNGLFHISFGIETIDAKIRSYYGKPVYERQRMEKMLHHFEIKLDISVHIFFMLGHPQETEENMLKTFEYGKSLYPDLCSFIIYGVIRPFPGTEFYEHMKAANLIVTEEWRHYAWLTPVIKTSIKPKKFESLLANFWTKTYRRPKVFRKQILNLFSNNQFRRCIAYKYFYFVIALMKRRFLKLHSKTAIISSKNNTF